MGNFWNVDLPKRKKEKEKKRKKKKESSKKMCDAGRPFRRMHARVFLPSFCPHVPLRYIELRNWNWQARHGWGRTLLILELEPTNSQKPGSNLFFNLYSRIYKPINQKSDAVECTRDVMYTTR